MSGSGNDDGGNNEIIAELEAELQSLQDLLAASNSIFAFVETVRGRATVNHALDLGCDLASRLVPDSELIRHIGFANDLKNRVLEMHDALQSKDTTAFILALGALVANIMNRDLERELQNARARGDRPTIIRCLRALIRLKQGMLVYESCASAKEALKK